MINSKSLWNKEIIKELFLHSYMEYASTKWGYFAMKDKEFYETNSKW